MFLTLAYLIVDLYNGFKERRRAMVLTKLIQRHLQHTSILLRRLGKTADENQLSKLVRRNSAGWLENVLFEERSKQILSISPKITLGLEGWVSYLDSQDIPILPTYPTTDYSYVLFETHQADDAEDFLQQSFSVPISRRVKVVDCVEPVAWKSGLPFGIVARCSTENLTKLADAFLQGTLCLDDMLELHQMLSVDVEGCADRLLQSSRPGTSTPPHHTRSPQGSTGSIRSLWESSRENLQEERSQTDQPADQGTGQGGGRGSTQQESSGSRPTEHRGCASYHTEKPLNDSVQHLIRSFAETHSAPSPRVVDLCHTELDCGMEVEDEDTMDLYEGSNESLASSVADLREVRAEADQFAQTVEEVMTLDRAVISEMMDTMAIEGAGEGVGGESLSGPVEELAPETLTPLKRQRSMRSKPPNVLVYCGKKDSTRQFDAVKVVLEECLSRSRYVIYQLKHDEIKTVPWSENTALLVLASEKAYDGIDDYFLDYFKGNGTILSFGCAFDERFVGRIQTSSNLGVLSLTAFKQWRDVNVICGRHVYKNCDSLLTDVTLRSLASDKTSGYPVILEANHDLSTGVAVLCQVLLDKDPMELGINPEVFAMLKKSNSSRFEMLRHILTQLGLDCGQRQAATFSFGVLLTKKPNQRDLLLKSLQPRLNNGLLRSRKLSLQLVDSVKECASTVSADKLPLVTNPASAVGKHRFNVKEYQTHLETERLGQVVIYADVMATTMNVVDTLMFPVPRDLGVVAIAGRQTAGVGRGGNAWLSPPGCALFSVLVRVSTDSELGRRISFLQHLAGLAVVQGVTTMRGYQNLDLRLKWPNDIYFGSTMKFGGVVVNSSIMQSTIHANIGIGFNVDNKDPTICLNDMVRQYNTAHGTSLPDLSREVVIARTINWLEILIKSFDKHGPEKFLNLYYKRWLHGNAAIRLGSESGPEMTITGLDEYGYLQVETPEGATMSLHPDGNSFDMMKGLIAPKVR